GRRRHAQGSSPGTRKTHGPDRTRGRLQRPVRAPVSRHSEEHHPANGAELWFVTTMTGRIFDIQRFCIHDGPGIRTTVFLKGCALRCKWCSNPESQGAGPLLAFTAERCVGCGACAVACKAGAIRTDARTQLDRRCCTLCGECVTACQSAALEVIGRDVTVHEVISTVLRDRDYYEASGGGVTLSGGEP